MSLKVGDYIIYNSKYKSDYFIYNKSYKIVATSNNKDFFTIFENNIWHQLSLSYIKECFKTDNIKDKFQYILKVTK